MDTIPEPRYYLSVAHPGITFHLCALSPEPCVCRKSSALCPEPWHSHAGAGTALLALFSLVVFCGPFSPAPHGGSTGLARPFAALPAGEAPFGRAGRVLTAYEAAPADDAAAVALVQVKGFSET